MHNTVCLDGSFIIIAVRKWAAPSKTGTEWNVRTRGSHDSLPQNLQPNPLVSLPSLILLPIPVTIISRLLISPCSISWNDDLTGRRYLGWFPLQLSLVDLGLEMFEVWCSKRYGGRVRSYHVVGRNCSFSLCLQCEEWFVYVCESEECDCIWSRSDTLPLVTSESYKVNFISSCLQLLFHQNHHHSRFDKQQPGSMGRAEAGSTKAIANAIKAKGKVIDLSFYVWSSVTRLINYVRSRKVAMVLSSLWKAM